MDKKYCSNCGVENESNSAYCISCGNSLEEKTEQVKKKKKGKGCLIALIVILLIAGLIVGGIFLYKKLTYFEDPFEEPTVKTSVDIKSFNEQLNEDLASGKISKDQYVIQIAYALYEPDRVLYDSNDIESVDFEDLSRALEKYGNELSYDTMLYIYKKINLSDYTWSTGDNTSYENDNEASVYNVSMSYMSNKPDGNVKKLDGVVLSKNKHFLVYYSTEGRYPTKKSQAKKIANYLEGVVDTYKKDFNLDFDYDIQYNIPDGALTKPYSYNSVVKLLEENNIDEKYLKTAMPVYLIDNDSEKTNHSGFYVKTIDNVFLRLMYGSGPSILNSAEQNINYTTYGFPYFVLSSSLIGTDDQYLVGAHELFHHYQKYICGNGEYKECVSGEFTTETTASEAALHAYKPKAYVSLNGHSGVFLDGLNKDKGISYMAYNGGATGGYVTYVFANSYEEVVSNGSKIMFDSMKYEKPLEYIYNNSGGKYSKAMLKTSEKILTEDYSNKALIPRDQISHEQIYPKNQYNLPGSFGIQSKYVATSGIDYYFIKTYNYPEKSQLSFSKSLDTDKDLYLLLFVRQDSKDKYKLVYTHNLDKEFILNIDDFRYYNDVAFSVVNGGISKSVLYSFEIKENGEKTPTVTAKSLNLKEPKTNKKNIVTSKIVCSKVESEEYIKSTYQVLVSFDNKDEVNDFYVKGTIEMEDNAIFKIAKGVTTGAVFLLKQKDKEEFGKITLRTYDEGNRYIILGRVKDDYYTAIKSSFNTESTSKEDIFNAIQNEGFTCQYQ